MQLSRFIKQTQNAARSRKKHIERRDAELAESKKQQAALRQEIDDLKREVERMGLLDGSTIKAEHVVPTESMVDAIEKVQMKYLKKNVTYIK